MVTKKELIDFIQTYYEDTEDIAIARINDFKTIIISLRTLKKISLTWFSKEGG
jgi:hypothetical protein